MCCSLCKQTYMSVLVCARMALKSAGLPEQHRSARYAKRAANARVRELSEAGDLGGALELARVHARANEHTAAALLAGVSDRSSIRKCLHFALDGGCLRGRGSVAFSVLASSAACAHARAGEPIQACAQVLSLRELCWKECGCGLGEGALAAALSALARSDDVRPRERDQYALALLRAATEDSVASASLFTITLQATRCKPKHWESIRNLLNRAQPPPDPQLLALCVKASSLAGDDGSAMEMSCSSVADVFVGNAYMSTLSRRHKSRTARKLWHSMARFERDHYTVSAALSAAAKCADEELGEDVLQWIEDRGLLMEHNEHTATAAVAYMGSVGSWQRAIALVERFVYERGMREPVCSAGLRALAQSGQLKRALRLFEEMQNSGILPSRRTFDALLPALELAGYCESAFQLRQLKRSLRTLKELYR